MDNLFSGIINGSIPANKIYQDDRITIFYDKFPRCDVHFLVVPNRRIVSLDEIVEPDISLIGYMLYKGAEKAKDLGLKGYRVVINVGKDGGQEVPHLHIHVMGGKGLKDSF